MAFIAKMENQQYFDWCVKTGFVNTPVTFFPFFYDPTAESYVVWIFFPLLLSAVYLRQYVIFFFFSYLLLSFCKCLAGFSVGVGILSKYYFLFMLKTFRFATMPLHELLWEHRHLYAICYQTNKKEGYVHFLHSLPLDEIKWISGGKGNELVLLFQLLVYMHFNF